MADGNFPNQNQGLAQRVRDAEEEIRVNGGKIESNMSDMKQLEDQLQKINNTLIGILITMLSSLIAFQYHNGPI